MSYKISIIIAGSMCEVNADIVHSVLCGVCTSSNHGSSYRRHNYISLVAKNEQCMHKLCVKTKPSVFPYVTFYFVEKELLYLISIYWKTCHRDA
jgi:hypothetical protein